MATLLARGQITIAAIKDGKDGADGKDAVIYTLEASPSYIRLNSDGSIDYTNGYIDKGDEYESDKYLVVRGYKVAKGVRDNRFSTEARPITLRLTINDGSAYHEYTPSDGDSVSIDFEPKYEDSYYSMLQEISNSGLNSVRVDMCEGSEYNTNKILATCDIPIIRNGKDGQKGDQGDKGEDGVDGTDGKDAVSVLVENAPLVFDTNDDGIVSPDISKLAKVKIMRGNRNVSDECSDVYSRNDMCVNCKCGVTQENGYISVFVSGSYITKNDVVVDDVSQGEVSATSGYAVAQATYGGVTYFVQVPFSVNVAKFTGVVAFDNNGYKAQFKEVTNRLNDTATKDDLKKAESDFKQTAREISLSVSEKAMGRRNMLSGSALRRKVGEGVRFEGNGYVSLSDNYLGTNSYVGTSKAKDTYLGLHWIGASDSQSVRVQKGHTYTLSCWIKADSTSIPFTMEAVWQASASDYTRPAGYAGPGNDGSGFQIRESVNKVNIWQLITTTFTIPSDASYEYLEIYLFFRSNDDGIYTVSMSRPMMEEGNKYSGIWSLSEKDFDYIGGNLLDNTATFANDDNDNVNFVNKVIENGYEGKYNVAYAKNEKKDTHTEIAMWGTQSGNLSLTYDTDYVFSFLAKGTGRIVCYMYKDGTPIIYTDNKETNGRYISDGHIDFALEPTWRKFYVHWRVAGSNLPTDVLIRAADITEAWIAQPKLEVGCTMTDWTEKRTDMVDRQALLATGIDITNGKITITANNTIFRDNNGTTIALFANGKINASLIDVKHLWAISEDGTSKVGYFGNDTDSACIIDNNTTAPLFVGGSTALRSNFYVTSNGKMVAKDAEISGTLKGVSGTFNELTDGTGKLSIGFQDNGFFIKGYTRFYNDVTIDGMLRSQGKSANYLALGVWARGTFGSNARLTLMCIDNHRYYYEGYDNTKRVQGSTLVSSDGAIDGHYPYLVSMRPVTSHLGMDDGEEDCEYYGASFDLVIIRTTSKSGYYKFTNCGYGKVFHVINGYDKQSVWIAYQGGWFELYGGMGITMAYLDSSMYTPTSTKAGAGFFILGTYDNTWV